MPLLKHGKPCGKCGGTLRYVSDRCCVPCKLAKRAKWRAENPDLQRVQNKKFATENHEYKLAYMRQWHVENYEHNQQLCREWRKANREHTRLYDRQRPARPL